VEESKPKRSGNRLVSWFAWLGMLLVSLGGKLKSLLPLLKFGKFGSTLFTMAVSVGAYALVYPLEFAVGLVVMIFIHEMGHVWAAKRKGLPVSAPAFIPFLGALITLKRQPVDAATEAYIAYGGPLVGTMGAVACHALGVWMDSEILLVIAMFGYFVNLFNLLPIHPLDGGRIVTAISRWLWVIGLVAGLVLILYLRSLVLAIIYTLFVFELWSTFGRRRRQTRTIRMEARVPIRHFEDAGILIPGENHRRELPFRQYCLVGTQEHLADVGFPGLGTIVTFPLQGEMHRARLVNTFRPAGEDPVVRMVVEADVILEPVGGMSRDERYYQVPSRTRWAFGLAYLGLAAFLVWMLSSIGQHPMPVQA
jgi:Zn-dependent protease